MSKRFFISILIILTVVNLSATATILIERFSKETPPAPFEKRLEKARDLFGRRFEMSPEQKQEFGESMRKHWQNVSPRLDEYHNIHQQLVKELYSKNPDTIKIHDLVNGIGDLQTQIRLMTVDHIMESNRFLSKEQREDLMRFFMSSIDRDFRTPGFRKFHRNRDKTHEHMRRKLLEDSLEEIDNQ